MKKSNKQAKKKNDTIIKTLQQYRDIETGRVLPTLPEFFEICIIFEIGENVNLKDLYPAMYRDIKKEIEKRSKELEKEKAKKK